MECIKCGSNNTSKFFIERIPCNHCGETIELEYEVCNDCHIMWKSVDGEVINNSFDAPEELDRFLDNELGEDIEEFLKQAFDIPIEEVTITNASSSMQSMVHRCIRCEAIAYETKPRFFHCADCGFEWEVL